GGEIDPDEIVLPNLDFRLQGQIAGKPGLDRRARGPARDAQRVGGGGLVKILGHHFPYFPYIRRVPALRGEPMTSRSLEERPFASRVPHSSSHADKSKLRIFYIYRSACSNIAANRP